MKRIFLIILIFGLVYCRNSNLEITDNEIKEATAFFMDSIVSKSTHRENYTIIPSYDAKLSGEDFLNILHDSLFTKKDVDFMKSQYDKLKQRNIKDFVKREYYLKFNPNQPKNNGQVCYHMDPPLFTVNKEKYVIYFKTFFWAKDELKWNDFYIIFSKNGIGWKLEGVIKSPSWLPKATTP
jgi:hypothetical protein